MPKLRTTAQNSKMFGLAAKVGMSHDDLRDHAFDITGGRTEHTSEMTVTECDELIAFLERVQPGAKPKVPLRTIQYRRKKAGVKIIVSPKQTGLIEKLLKQRSIGGEGERALCQHLFKHDEPRTTKEASKLIEALKAMNARDSDVASLKKEAA